MKDPTGTQEIASSLAEQTRSSHRPIPTLESFRLSRQIRFQETTLSTLGEILNEAAPSPYSPRTTAFIRVLDNSQKTLQSTLETNQKSLQALQSRMEARDLEEKKARERAQAPLSMKELASTGFAVILPIVAGSIGRGIGGVCDTDSNTTFTSEAPRISASELGSTISNAAQMTYAYITGGNAGLRQTSERVIDRQTTAAFNHVTDGYDSTISRDNKRIQEIEREEKANQDKAAKAKPKDNKTERCIII